MLNIQNAAALDPDMLCSVYYHKQNFYNNWLLFLPTFISNAQTYEMFLCFAVVWQVTINGKAVYQQQLCYIVFLMKISINECLQSESFVSSHIKVSQQKV